MTWYKTTFKKRKSVKCLLQHEYQCVGAGLGRAFKLFIFKTSEEKNC